MISSGGSSATPVIRVDQASLDRAPAPAERFGELAGVLAAGFGERGATAPASSHDLGDLLDEGPRVQTRREIVGDRHEDRDLPSLARAENDHARSDLALEVVGERPHPGPIEPFDFPDDEPDAVHLLAGLITPLRRSFAGPGLRELQPQLLDLAAQRFVLLLHGRDVRTDLLALVVQR